ncbi:MAG: 4Fe-4S binding protein [Elusimicrobia bacterium]|nr:4Fe-4S binding protein [Elusimicrobiota bacterium]
MQNAKLRKFVQIISLLLINGNFRTFLDGALYKGGLKKICVPVLNCYSCPLALTSCPIGAIQQFLVFGIRKGLSGFLYIFSLIGVLAVFAGRFFCGWVCPFGLLQELVYVKGGKAERGKGGKEIRHSAFRILRIVFLFGFVLTLPWLLVNQWGIGEPTFCRYICPVGTLEAGIWGIFKGYAVFSPALILKFSILFLVVYFSVKIFRLWCRVCPLGLLLGFFNKISFLQLRKNDKCDNCGICKKVCPMDIDMPDNLNSVDCIRCKKCVAACPRNALVLSFKKQQ